MICDKCRHILEYVDLEASNGVHQIGPAISRHDERSVEQIRWSCSAGCCICRRIAESVFGSKSTGQGLRSINLKYSVTDLKGYFQIRILARESRVEQEQHFQERRDASIFHFELLPGPATCDLDAQHDQCPASTRPDRAKEYIRWRLRACTNEHPECRRGNWWRPEVVGIEEFGDFHPGEVEDIWQPTRLLKICEVGDQNTASVRLVETANHHCGPYVALSHCWGGLCAYRLEQGNLTQLIAGLDCLSLPKTFREAIQVAMWLDIEYIWIDSLCIMQDSVEDWRYESAQMHRVYQFAQVTISASAAENSEGGLFFETQQPVSCVVPSLKLRGHETSEYRIIDEEIWRVSVDDGPLKKRAWTLQERMLSSRILHFGKEQIFFQCARTLECESYPADTAWVTTKAWPKGRCSLRPRVSDVDASHQCAVHVRIALRWNGFQHFRNMWQNIVRVYSSCELTFQTDKLQAIGGLARWLHSWHGDSYYAGIWEEGMMLQLLWTVPTCAQASGEPSKRPDEYIAPSWSWASVIGVIEMTHSSTPDNNFTVVHLAKVIEVEVEKVGMRTFGQISGGHLHVQGRLYDVVVKKHQSEPTLSYLRHHDYVIRGHGISLWIYFDVNIGSAEQYLSFLPLWHRIRDGDDVYGLLLSSDAGKRQVYSRVGALVMSRASCRELHLDIQPLSNSGPVSRTYSGSDIVHEGFQTVQII